MGKPRTYRLTDLISPLLEQHEAAQRAAQNNQLRGPVTRIDKLDRDLGGTLANGLTILQGAPGIGKTAFGLQVAARCGFPAVYVSAEMSPVVLFRRIIASRTRTFLSKLSSGQLETCELLSLADRTAREVPNLSILDATLEPADKGSIVEAAGALLEIVNGTGLLIIIDALQTWARAGGMGGFISDYDLMTQGVHTARSLATELACPVLLISHRSRAGQAGGGLYASKGSGDIEYQAEAVIELAPEGEGRPDAAGEVALTLRLLKNRHGECGSPVLLRFCGRLQSFREVSAVPVSLNPDDHIPGHKGRS